ncbi:hypothetical protein SAMN05216349_11931 [Oribacterium sp. KHPX15]|uniref:hypothetical protein n=1 Tax=Oribacterium sp. KHPX15 TaxID=1855342 RepID=UPI00089BDFF3|nr:hypothetical protein [Oribacterium sp. KHPX15]SEA61929.1 hypothetical protein SAMN05216349_11931 [Oribacterium sp. KHPX15]
MGLYTEGITYSYLFPKKVEEMIDTTRDIENMSPDAGAEAWKKLLEDFSSEYAISSKFALMRIFYARLLGNEELGEVVNYKAGGKTYELCAPTVKQAEAFTRFNLSHFAEYLNEVASDRILDSSDKETCSKLIDIALKRTRSLTLITKEEALRLGHYLGFDLLEMSWFLNRVFVLDESFNFKLSDDIIDAYVFINNDSCRKAIELKERYKQSKKNTITDSTPDDKPDGFTEHIEPDLKEKIDYWKKNSPEKIDDCFIEWLVDNSAYLDKPSGTATAIYRDIFVYIYNICTTTHNIPSSDEFADNMIKIANRTYKPSEDQRDLLYDGSQISPDKCANISGAAMTTIKEIFTDTDDRQQAWRWVGASFTGRAQLKDVHLDGKGTGSLLESLLMGKTHVNKQDILILLWNGFCLCWDNEWSLKDPEDICETIAALMETANVVLEKSYLTGFYPPHPMEQVMMRSIISAHVDGTQSPGFSYSVICNSLKDN